MDEKERKILKPNAETGIKIAASGIGAGFGALVGGPIGGALGALTPPALERLAAMAQERLAERGKRRISTVLEAARNRYEQNERLHRELRADGFFGGEETDYTAADELLEATIRAAHDEYAERKIPFLGNLLGNLPYTAEIDRDQANVLVKLSSELSYTQFCLLALFSRRGEFDTTFSWSVKQPKREDYRDDMEGYRHFEEDSKHASVIRKADEKAAIARLGSKHQALRQEVYGLYTRQLVKHYYDSMDNKLQLPRQLSYPEMYVATLGGILVRMLSLGDIQNSELERLATTMREDPPGY